MRTARKLALAVALPVGALLAALLVAPLLFRDRIAARLKTEVDAAVDARVAWRGATLSLVRDFPDATLSLDGLSVVGVAPFAGDTLLALRQARLVLDAGSVVRYLRAGGRIVVREVVFAEPVVHLRVLADGRASWNIVRPQPASGAASSKAIGVTLRDLRITGGTLTLDDRQSRVVASVTGLEESLRGDFARDRVTLATRTRADSVSLRFAGIPYLSHAGLALDAQIDADLPARRFTFAHDSLRINRLLLAFAGSVVANTPSLGLDFTFAAPSTAFGDILSLVPAVYAHDFARLQTSGSMSASGRVKGAYGPHAFPALALRAHVENGAFRHPALPLPARDIAMDLTIDNPGGDVDNTVVDLERLHAVVGGRPLDARLVLRTPVRDPDVDLRLAGALDLADIGRTMPLDGVSQLSGTVAADVAVRARLSDVDAGRYDRVAASGTVNVGRLALRTTAVPRPIAVDTAALRLTPRTAELTTFGARIGNSDLRGAGSLDNLVGFLLRGDDLRGSATVASTHFDLNEWRSSEKTTEVIPVPSHVDFSLKASAATVAYGALTMANVHGDLHVKDQRVTLQELSMQTLRGTVVANGFYETTVPARPTFDVDLRLAAVDIPAAFAALTTVQKLAPVARWAQGSLTGTVGLKGPLGQDMTPVFTALTGKGALETDRLVVQGAPVFEKLADALSLDQLRKPTLGAVKAAYDLADGRLHVKPFVVKVNGVDMTVAGSNGVDQSLAYDLSFAMPRTALGAAGSSAVARLAAQAGASATDLAASQTVQLGAKVTGTATNPTVKPSFGGTGASARELARSVVLQGAAAHTGVAGARVDSAALRAMADAERQAAAIRAQAQTLAASTRSQANERADSLLAHATNPMARIAAQAATDRIRRDADQRANQIVQAADGRADALVAAAKAKAAARPATAATARP